MSGILECHRDDWHIVFLTNFGMFGRTWVGTFHLYNVEQGVSFEVRYLGHAGNGY